MNMAPSFIPPFAHTDRVIITSGAAHHQCSPTIHPLHTTTRVHFSTVTRSLTTPPWRFILLSDGHIHNLLSHLINYPLPLNLLQTETLPNPPHLPVPEEEQLPNAPCIRRMITLNGPDGVALLHASSLWSRSIYDTVMRPRENQSLYEVFRVLRLEVSRAVLAVHFGTCDDLCGTFDVKKGSMMWARDYVFRKEGVPFLVVHEVLSPRLQKYLGEIVPPQQICDHPYYHQENEEFGVNDEGHRSQDRRNESFVNVVDQEVGTVDRELKAVDDLVLDRTEIPEDQIL